MKRIFFSSLLTLFALFTTGESVLLAQQVPLFSQYMFNGLYLNPAYAGYKNEFYLQGSYRTQWQGWDGAPQLLAVSADGSLAKGKVGLGLLVSVDKAGTQQILSLMSDYSYKFNVGEFTTLSFGLGLGAVQYSMDETKLHPGDPNDPRIIGADYNQWLPEANAGLYLYSDRFYVGISAMNLLSPYIETSKDKNVEQTETHMFFTAGVMLPIARNFQLKPSLLYREDFTTPSSVDANLMLLMYDRVWVGASYRMGLSFWKDEPTVDKFQSDAVSFIVEVFATKSIRVGYSYDLGFTNLRGQHNGTHEVSLGIYIAPRLKRMLSPRYF